MKILHVTPHLGGGVGKAHAAMSGILAETVEQTFLLLEQPRDHRYAEVIADTGARVTIARSLDDVVAAAGTADIVQFEFWNHPRLFECLGRAELPATRTVFWSHVSGLFKPVVQPGLVKEAGRFVFSTQASLSLPFIEELCESVRRRISVINSGFGFPNVSRREFMRTRTPAIAYLGTVDFAKMHPGFFDVIDGLESDGVKVAIWGGVDPSGPVVERARAMRHPERVHFGGHTDDPAQALAAADIFFYPLQPDHYGTAENALIEAMSLGLTPVVLNNPAEAAIVRHDETGLVARSIDECTVLLKRLISSPEWRERISRNAAMDAATVRAPRHSARQFVDLWQALAQEDPKPAQFRRVIGDCPADWFLATICIAGTSPQWSEHAGAEISAKGTLAHFESVFPQDDSLAHLRESGLRSCRPTNGRR